MIEILDAIKSHSPLNKDEFILQDVQRDGNCFYRTLPLFYSKEESNYSFF